MQINKHYSGLHLLFTRICIYFYSASGQLISSSATLSLIIIKSDSSAALTLTWRFEDDVGTSWILEDSC